MEEMELMYMKYDTKVCMDKIPIEQLTNNESMDNLQQWENNKLMICNPAKCEVLIATNKKFPIHSESVARYWTKQIQPNT